MISRTFALLFAIGLPLCPATLSDRPLLAADLDDVRQAGLITGTTADSITIAEPNSGTQLTFVVNAATKITRRGKPILLRSVQVGEFADISAREINERRMAASIRVSSP